MAKNANQCIFIYFVFFSEASVAGYTYCNEPGLNFSTNSTNYSEDDADFAPGRRGKTSRVGIFIDNLFKIKLDNFRNLKYILLDEIRKKILSPFMTVSWPNYVREFLELSLYKIFTNLKKK